MNLRKPDNPDLTPRALVNAFLDRMGMVLLVFGLVLFGVGALVQASRYVRMRGVDASESAPRFEDTVRAADPAAIQPRRVAQPVKPTVVPDASARPDRLVIPSIELDTDVREVGWEARIVNGENLGNIWQTADYAAGFHQDSATPGEPGNTVISGHNNIRGAVFKDLHEVGLGDRVYIYDAEGQRFGYEVVENFIVQEEGAPEHERLDNTQWIRRTPDERLTLVTCFPPWSNTHRAIVVAFPLDENDTGVVEATGSSTQR